MCNLQFKDLPNHSIGKWQSFEFKLEKSDYVLFTIQKIS